MPEAVRLNPAAGRLRNLKGYGARPPPPALQINYQTPGSHNDRGTGGGRSPDQATCHQRKGWTVSLLSLGNGPLLA